MVYALLAVLAAIAFIALWLSIKQSEQTIRVEIMQVLLLIEDTHPGHYTEIHYGKDPSAGRKMLNLLILYGHIECISAPPPILPPGAKKPAARLFYRLTPEGIYIARKIRTSQKRKH